MLEKAPLLKRDGGVGLRGTHAVPLQKKIKAGI